MEEESESLSSGIRFSPSLKASETLFSLFFHLIFSYLWCPNFIFLCCFSSCFSLLFFLVLFCLCFFSDLRGFASGAVFCFFSVLVSFNYSVFLARVSWLVWRFLWDYQFTLFLVGVFSPFCYIVRGFKVTQDLFLSFSMFYHYYFPRYNFYSLPYSHFRFPTFSIYYTLFFILYPNQALP